MTILLNQAYNSELQSMASLRVAFEKGLGKNGKGLNGKDQKNEIKEDEIEENVSPTVPTNGSRNNNVETSNGKRFLLTPPSRNSFVSSLPFPGIRVLRPKHVRILSLYVTGQFKRTQISELVGVTDATITNVINSRQGQEYIKNHYEGIKGEFDSLAAPAVSALRQGLHSDDEERRVKTAVDYFKLIGSQTKKVIEHTGKDGGAIQHHVENVKEKLFAKLGLDPNILIEVENELSQIEAEAENG